MSQQLSFLSRSPAPVKPAPGQTGPRLWIRRVAIWRTRDTKPVRDISLVPGLNIVWSPDPDETPSSDSEAPTALGHGGGKTLLCRLIRYCLGEDRFATDALTEQIRSKFPDGAVGAVVVVDGADWCVVRPIGLIGHHVAMARSDLDDVVAQEANDTGMKPLIDAIAAAFIGAEAAALIGDGTMRTAWLTALAWLSRDQECRFDDVLDWRAAASGSESPVRARDVAKADRLDFLRVLIRAMTPEELDAGRERDAAKGRRDEAEVAARHHEWDVRQRRASLIRALGMDETAVPSGPLALEPLRQAVRAALTSNARVTGPEAALASVEAARDATVSALAEVDAAIQHLVKEIPKVEARLARVKGEHLGIGLELRDAEIPVCPVCEVPIDKALAEGCGISLEQHPGHLAEVRARRQRAAEEVSGLETEVLELRSDLAELRTVVRPASSAAVESAALDLKKARAAAVERTTAWDNERAVRDLAVAYEQQTAANERLESLEKDLKLRGERISTMREAQATLFQALSARFDDAVAQLARGASGSVAITGRGLDCNVQFGGNWTSAAIESLKVLALDLAVMILSIEGKTRLPAFLLHDSPREADLGLAAYHPLFQYARSLEAMGSKPLFQYILTTTTRPPAGMQQEPWLRCKLRSAPPADRLLTENL